MDARVWLYMRGKSYSVGWYDPDGVKQRKSFGPTEANRKERDEYARQIDHDLRMDTYAPGLKKTWEEFRREYEREILAGRAEATVKSTRFAFANFERLARPKRVSAITTRTIDRFTADRAKEANRRAAAGGELSPASVNADLRAVKAALKIAVEWDYLPKMPKVRFLREPKKLPVYVTPEHFALIYAACDTARLPRVQGYTTGDWWRALLVLAYTALGWRIGQLIAIRREDVNLEAGTIVARAKVSGNKAKADRAFPLHPVAVEHLQRLAGFGDFLLPWEHNYSTLYEQLRCIERAAGTPEYGFHCFRKGFGTMNAPRMSLPELQAVMQHENPATTLRYYVNPMAQQQQTMAKLHVPDVLRTGTGG